MSSALSVREFLHDVLSNRARPKLSVEQFDSLINSADKIEKFSEKGLFIVTMTEQLLKISNVNYSAIKKFMNDFLAGLKPQKPRRQRQEGQHRRRRRRPVDSTNVAHDIRAMAQESVTNPSNLQMARIGVEVSSQQGESSKVSENESKRSDQNRKDIEFAEQLNIISQRMEFATGQITGQLIDQQQNQFQTQPMDQFSKSSSSTSSQSFGLVSNLSQKMDLLKRDNEQPQKKTKTIHRTAARVDATMTKRKPAKKLMLDQNLTLQKTKGTLNETTYEERSLSFQYSPWIDQYHQQAQFFEMTDQQFQETIKQNPLSIFSNMVLSARKQGRREMNQEIPAELTQFDTGYQNTMQDFTSQPLPQISEQFDVSHIHMNELSIFHYQETNPTLAQISQKVNRPEHLVFYEMLFKMQKGEIVLTQENAAQFGQIRVKLLAQ